ncbi:MAG: hypothetical protein ABFS56_18245 [Pseudomonadota bacterium]
MCIIRVIKKKNFAQISNEVFEGQKLSWPAKGLLGYLLSRPNNWYFTVRDLINQGCSGRDGVLSILKELEKQGYVVRQKNTDKKGRFKWEKIVYENPSLNPIFKSSDTTEKRGIETDDKSPSSDSVESETEKPKEAAITQLNDLQNLAPSSELSSTQSPTKQRANHSAASETEKLKEAAITQTDLEEKTDKLESDIEPPSDEMLPTQLLVEQSLDFQPSLEESDSEEFRYLEEYDKMLPTQASVEQTYTKEAEIEEPSTQPQETVQPCASQNTQKAPDISFALKFSEQVKRIMISMLIGIEDAQELINVLEMKMDAGIVRDPIAYLSGIIRRYRSGDFTPVTKHNSPPGRPDSQKNADLVFTQDFTEETKTVIANMLHTVDEPQKVVQTLEAQMEKTVVKDPIQYLGGIIKSCHDGTFTPVLTEKQIQKEVAEREKGEEQAIKDCPFCDKYGYVGFQKINTGYGEKWSRICEHTETSILRSVEELSERLQEPVVVYTAKPGFRGPAEKYEEKKPERKPSETKAHCIEVLRQFNSRLAQRFINAGGLSPA